MTNAIEFTLAFLLNALWIATLTVGIAAVCSILLKNLPAKYKYAIWIAALGISLILPLSIAVSGRKAAAAAPAEATISSEATAGIELDSIAPDRTVEPARLGRAPGLPSLPVGPYIAIVISAIYLLFVFYRAAELVIALRRTRVIVRRAWNSPLPESLATALSICNDAVDARRSEILFSADLPVPVTIGDRRPVIILPEQFLNETDQDVLVTALGHELVHIERRDYAFNLLFEIICLPISFHPAAVYAKRRISHMRELCCDEMVATRLLNAEVYARSIINIAGAAHPLKRLSPIITVGITDAENLEVRIMSLLNKTKISLYKKAFLATAAVALLAVPLAVAAYFSPGVNVNAAVAPQPQPTEPVQDKELGEVKSDREFRITSDRQAIERKIEELNKAQQDPSLTDRQRAEYAEMARRLKLKLEASRNGSEVGWAIMDDKMGRERHELEMKLDEVKKAIEDPSLTDQQRAEYKNLAQKLTLRLEMSRNESADLEKRELEVRPDFEVRADTEKLASEANVKMDQAIETALASHPGKLKEKGIGKVNGEVVYKILIVNATGTPDSNATMVIVSGADGRIIKSENALIRLDVVKSDRP